MSKELISPMGIFCFYDTNATDTEMCNELVKHLSSLIRRDRIVIWDTQSIEPGAVTKEEILEKVKKASIFLILISSDFIYTKYSDGDEMKIAMKRHRAKEARVIPILLRQCLFEDFPFADLEALPKSGQPIANSANHDIAFTEIAGAIRLIVKELSTSTPSSQNLVVEQEALRSSNGLSPSEPVDIAVSQAPEQEPIPNDLLVIASPDNSILQTSEQQPLSISSSQMDNNDLRKTSQAIEDVPSDELKPAVPEIHPLNESIRFQNKVNELQHLQLLFHKLILELEGLVLSIQFVMMTQDSRRKNTLYFNTFDQNWEQVKQSIEEVQDFAATEMQYIEPEHFSIDAGGIQGPDWIKDLFVLQSSFEENLEEQYLEGIEKISRDLLSTSRYHLSRIELRLSTVVERLGALTS